MLNIAVVDKCPSNIDYNTYFEFRHNVFNLCDTYLQKILKKDITLDIEQVLADYDFVIVVGAEAAKYVAGLTSTAQKQGVLVKDKFIPLMNPKAVSFNPKNEQVFNQSIIKINSLIDSILEGDYLPSESISYTYEIVTDPKRAMSLIEEAFNYDLIALDSETSSLYPRDGYVLGISMSWREDFGIYIESDCIDEEVETALRNLFKLKRVVFHNCKFDIAFLKYHFDFEFKAFEDLMLVHYTLDETKGTHGLKSLALQYTDMGDYDRDLDDYVKEYCRKNKIKKEDFSYAYIPTDILGKYAACDAVATLRLFNKFFKVLNSNNTSLLRVYNDLLIPGTKFLMHIEENGVPFSKEALNRAHTNITENLLELTNKLWSYTSPHRSGEPDLVAFEKLQGKAFNPASVNQLRSLFFDFLGIEPTGIMTDTGQHSTNAEAMEIIKESSELAGLLLEVRKLSKIRSTYIEKIIPALDRDSRLRTGFNLHSTTSGRLSSSGKLNMQQLPRDNKVVKACIQARPGYVIVSQDLKTAEMYYAAALSGDVNLQNLFKSSGDFHSSVAVEAFNLPCKPSEVKELYPKYRQASKAVSFGVLYGSGPAKVAETVGCSLPEAKEIITKYFKSFPMLEKWLQKQKAFIKKNGYIYSAFGRKRRLLNATSTNNAVAAGEIRSGVNMLIQSVASDINLLAGIKMVDYLRDKGYLDKALIFAVVHDSIIAEVHVSILDEYLEALKTITQFEYKGVSIEGCPIGVDVEIGEDYSFSGEIDENYKNTGHSVSLLLS